MGEEIPASRGQLILKSVTSIAGAITSKLPTRPLLPITNTDAHPIAQNLAKLELGKFALALATAAALGMLSSQKFPAAQLGYLAVAGLMCGCAAVWNGILFGKTSLEAVGITLIFVCFYGLVASFLPISFSWACWLSAAFSLFPFLSLFFKPVV